MFYTFMQNFGFVTTLIENSAQYDSTGYIIYQILIAILNANDRIFSNMLTYTASLEEIKRCYLHEIASVVYNNH